MKTDVNATFEELVSLLSQGIGQRTLYFSSHPRVQEYSRQFTTMLHDLLAREGKDRFFLGYAEGSLLHNGIRLIGPTILGKRTIEFLTKINSGGILFHAGTTSREILEIFDLTASIQRNIPTNEELRLILDQNNVANIEFSPPYEDPNWFGQFLFDGTGDDSSDPATEYDQHDMVPVYQNMYDSVQQSHNLAETNSPIEIDDVRSIGEQLVGATQDGMTDMMRFVKYPDYDTFTVGHSVRVAMISVLVAHRAGLPDSMLIELATAGLLHDVGKAKVPHEILYKPDRLTDEEFQIISKHPVDGAVILLENQNASPMAIGAAWGHHLRFDGGGYPEMEKWGLSTKVTSLLTVCDVFEAITAIRPYKRAMEPRRAYEIMLRDRGAFDIDCLAALVNAMGIYPPGSSVSLSTGERGIVVLAGREIDKPVVRVTHDRQGESIPIADQSVVDLSTPTSLGIRVMELLEPTGVPATEGIAVTNTAHGPCDHRHDNGTGLGKVLGRRR